MPLENGSKSFVGVVFGRCPNCGRFFVDGDIVDLVDGNQLAHEDCGQAGAIGLEITNPDWEKAVVDGSQDVCDDCCTVFCVDDLVSVHLKDGERRRVCPDCSDDYEDLN